MTTPAAPARPADTPFDPPASVPSELELQAGPPRPIPEELRKGFFERRSQALVLYFLFLGAALFAASLLARGTTLGAYFLGTPYLAIAAGVAFALGAAVFVVQRVSPGAYRYVTEGFAVACRVLDARITVAAVHNGSPVSWRYECLVELRHPEAGQLVTAPVRSPDFGERTKRLLARPIRIGEYLTAVSLPGKFEKTLTLYGFLRLNPDVDFLREAGAGAPKPPALWALLGTLATVGLIAMGTAGVNLGLILPSMEALAPRAALLAAVPAFLLGAAVSVLMLVRNARRKRKALEAFNEAARREGHAVEVEYRGRAWDKPLVVLAGGFFAVFLAVVGFGGVNAALDRSAPRYEVVYTGEGVSTRTYAFLFRSYELICEIDGKKRFVAISAAALDAIRGAGGWYGAIEWRDGAFGVRRIAAVHPVETDEYRKPVAVLLPNGRREALPAPPEKPETRPAWWRLPRDPRRR